MNLLEVLLAVSDPPSSWSTATTNPLKLPFDKNIELKIGFTSYSKYSYSIFGIEIPEFKIISNNNK